MTKISELIEELRTALTLDELFGYGGFEKKVHSRAASKKGAQTQVAINRGGGHTTSIRSSSQHLAARSRLAGMKLNARAKARSTAPKWKPMGGAAATLTRKVKHSFIKHNYNKRAPIERSDIRRGLKGSNK